MTTYELVHAVLMAHHQDGGVSQISVKQLCKATGRSRRGVQMSLRTMRQQGLLSDGVHLGEGAFIRIVEAPVNDDDAQPTPAAGSEEGPSTVQLQRTSPAVIRPALDAENPQQEGAVVGVTAHRPPAPSPHPVTHRAAPHRRET